MHIFMQELNALQQLQRVHGVCSIIDLIENDVMIVVVIQNKGETTLSRLMQSRFRNGCTEEFTRRTIYQIASILEQVHAKGVMHRALCTDYVRMRTSSKNSAGYKVCRIGDFDFGFHLKKRSKINNASEVI